MQGTLSLERHGAVTLVTLRRPEKRNALSIELRLELADAFRRLGAADDVAAVVLTGAGSAFCSGMDTAQFGGDAEHRQRLYDSSVSCFRSVGECPKPVIAAINGPAVAGGFALALLCDLRIAATTARLGFLETRRGIPASYAAAMRALSPALAAELVLSGRVLEAQEALALGVVGSLHDPGALPARALALAAELAVQPRWMLIESKRRILSDAEQRVGRLVELEEAALREALLRPRPDPAA